MTQQQEPRRFSRDEVGDLIETASKLEWAAATESTGDVSLDELKSIAAEMGISDQALAAAIARQERDDRAAAQEAADEQARKNRVSKSWRDWRSHLASYLGAMPGIVLIDWITGGGLDWWYWPAIGWGIGLAIHTSVLIANRGEMPED